MHWAALDAAQKHEAGREIGSSFRRIGVWAGLVGGLLVSACSFNLPARACDSTSCTNGGGDQGGPADMAPALADPGSAGPYKVAVISVTDQPALSSSQLYLPSDDGAKLSTKLATYPLVMLAPAQHMEAAELGDYASRLASHGIVVALYAVTDEGNQKSYRATALQFMGALFANMEPAVANHLDPNHVGLGGYQLGAEMSVAMASQMPTIKGLGLIDPQVVSGNGMGDIEGLQEMAKVKLTTSQPVLILGEDKSNMAMGPLMPCTNAAYNYMQFYTASTNPALAIDFTNATHGDFTTDYPNPACSGGTMAKSDTKRLAIKYLTAYFQLTLLDRADAKLYLTGPMFTTDAGQYTLTLTQK